MQMIHFCFESYMNELNNHSLEDWKLFSIESLHD